MGARQDNVYQKTKVTINFALVTICGTKKFALALEVINCPSPPAGSKIHSPRMRIIAHGILLAALYSVACGFLPASIRSTRSKIAIESSYRLWRMNVMNPVHTASVEHAPRPTETPRRMEGVSSTKPASGLLDVLTKWSFGTQDSGIPLPYSVVEGDPPQHCNLITKEHLDTLNRDGVVIVKRVLDQGWINYLRKATDWQVRNTQKIAARFSAE